MKEEHLSIDCPYCSKEITFDDNGNPVAINQEPLPPLSHRGLGGLISHDVTDWRGPHNYQRNSQYSPPPEAVTNGMPNLNAPVEEQVPFPSTETDEDIEKVHMADLREHGFAAQDPTLQHKQNN